MNCCIASIKLIWHFPFIFFTVFFVNTSAYAYKGGQYPESGLQCVLKDGKKTVWINSSVRGTIALNEEAVALTKINANKGKPLTGIDGKPITIGKDFIDEKFLKHLIKRGLEKCK